MSVSAWWVCGHREHHVFEFGQLGWHLEEWANQGIDKGHPVPNMCQADLETQPGEACMDSSHLYGPLPDKDIAEFTSEGYRLVSGTKPRDPKKVKLLKAAVISANHEDKDAPLEAISEAQGMAAIRPDTEDWHGRHSLTRRGGFLSQDLVRGLERFF